MPYIYAIEEHIYDDGIPPAEGEYKPYTNHYHIVSKEIAETHPEGRWKVVTHEGVDVGGWHYLRYFNEVKYDSPEKTGKDAIGQTLRVHDLVATGNGKLSDMNIAEVLGFTPKKIRLRPYSGMANTKEPSAVIKIDRSIIF